MNIITISSPNKTKVIKRKGTTKESMGYIAGYLSALNDKNVDLDTITALAHLLEDDDGPELA